MKQGRVSTCVFLTFGLHCFKDLTMLKNVYGFSQINRKYLGLSLMNIITH